MKAQQKLVHFIGQKIGLHDLYLDEDLQATINFGDAIVVTFLSEEGNALTAVSYVADYDADHDRMGKQLLAYNFLPPALGGGKLALDPTANSIILTHTWDACAMDGEAMYSQLEAFVNAVGAIREDLPRAMKEGSDNEVPLANPSSLMMYGNMA